MSIRLSGLSSYILFQRSLAIRNNDLFRTSEQLSTQKRINRPSDDPQGAKTVLTYRDALSKIKQYKDNIQFADQSLKASEVAVTNLKDILMRVKELALQGNNSTATTEARTALAEEVHQRAMEVLGIANTEVNGSYIFAGYHTDTKPFELDNAYPATPAATYSGDTNLRTVQISEDQTIQIQIRGDQLFQGDGTASTVDIFEVLGTLENTLRTPIDPNANPGDPDHFDTISAAMGDAIEDLDLAFNQALQQLTALGGKQNRLATTADAYDVQTETFKAFISDIEDKDIAEITMEFQRAQLALQATLGSAGAIMNMPSLMDFVGGR